MSKNYGGLMSEKIDVSAAITIDNIRVGNQIQTCLIDFTDHLNRICKVFERLERSLHILLFGITTSIIILSTSKAIYILRQSFNGNDKRNK